MNRNDIILKGGYMFEPKMIPKDTYVLRQDKEMAEYGLITKLDDRLIESISKIGELTVVASNSKIGKSILIKKNIKENKLVEITGKELNNIDIYELLAAKINLVIEDNINTSRKINTKIIEMKNDKNMTYYFDLKQQVLKKLSHEKLIIYIDDFHFLNKENIKDISIEIKSIIEKIKVIITTHPNKVNVITSFNPDLNGRIDVINIPMWDESELTELFEKGFESSNYKISKDNLEYCVSKSLGSPLIAQELGYTIVHYIKQDELTKITINNCLMSITRTFNHMNIILRIKENKGKQTEYKLKNNEIIKISALILEVLKIEPQKNCYELTELLELSKTIIENKEDLNIEKIKRGIKNIVNSINDENVIEVINEKLYIYDITLLYYLKNKI